MLDHISLGVSDLSRAVTFYDAALGPLGYERLWSNERGAGYGPPNTGEDEGLALFLQVGGNARLAAGPGFHLALAAPSREAVRGFHSAGLTSGGIDRGAPGLRPQYGETYYAAFLLDPDGHKLEAKCG